MNTIEIKSTSNMTVTEVMSFIRENRLNRYMVWNTKNTNVIQFQSISDLNRSIKPLAENGVHFRTK